MKQLPSVVATVFVLVLLLFSACEQPAGSDSTQAAREAAAAFQSAHAAVLGKTPDTIAATDGPGVAAALAAYNALGPDAQALLAAEKTLLDSLQARLDALAAADAFKTDHAAALSRTAASVMTSDEAAVAAALSAYEALDPDARALLAAEKALLDSLQEKIASLNSDSPAQAAANAFKTDHASLMDRTPTDLTLADEAAVNAALAAYGGLDPDAQALLAAEKALLDSLKTGIDALTAARDAADAFKAAHAAILGKTAVTVAVSDEAAVNAALAAYNALGGEAPGTETQALLGAEKALLDSLKTRIDALKAAHAFVTAHAAILSKTADTVALDDEVAVNAALAAYGGLDPDVQALLAAEKALLDSLQEKIDALVGAVEAYTTAHAAALSKTTASVMTSDETAVAAALAAYDALDAEVQALLAAEKALLDSLQEKIDALKGDSPAQTLANAFKTAHAAALGKTADTVTTGEEAAVTAALVAYNALDGETRALLAAEKALLDSLKTRIDALTAVRNAADAFKAAHAAILDKTAVTVAVSDEAAVNAALAAYNALGGGAPGAETQALLGVEKALLYSLKTRIDALKAAALYTTTHAAILGKTAVTVAVSDEAAVNAALAAYNALGGEAPGAETQALLGVEKALLDSLKTRIDALKAVNLYKTTHAAILGKTVVTVLVSDEAAVNAALTAHNVLRADAQALLTAEKALLNSLKSKISALQAEAFKTARAAVLSLTTDTVAIHDEPAVDAALAAYGGLDPDAQALLSDEKRLLDSLKEKIGRIGQEGSIPLWNPLDISMIGVYDPYPLEGRYTLMADIELENWKPIGSAEEPFTGSFNGNSNTITIKSFDESFFDDGETRSQGIGFGIFGWTRGSPEAPALIRNLTVRAELDQLVSETDACYVGALVGYADEYTELSSITVTGSLRFTNKNIDTPLQPVYVGGVAGALIASELRDSVVGADITGSGLAGNGSYNYVGGLVGMFDRNQVNRGLNPSPTVGVPFAGSSIVNCRSSGAIRGETQGSVANIIAGGIAGGAFYGTKTYYSGKIEGCFSTGNVTASGGGYWSWAGGIAGTISGDGHDDPDGAGSGTPATGPTRVVRCYATGTVTAGGPPGSWPYAGGIVGNNYYGGLVSQCWFNGAVKAEGTGITDYTGGIAGYNSKQYYGHGSRIEDCWSAGSVEGYLNAGGIVGQNQAAAAIERCYSRAFISVQAAAGAKGNMAQQGAGGIAGYNAVHDGRGDGAVINCVALNPSIISSNGFDLIHRVVGDGGGSYTNNRARQDMELIISGSPSTPPDTGANGYDGEDCVAKPAQSVYQTLGWNFTTVWKMAGDYPVLQWQ
jgi:hypothetical protein